MIGIALLFLITKTEMRSRACLQTQRQTRRRFVVGLTSTLLRTELPPAWAHKTSHIDPHKHKFRNRSLHFCLQGRVVPARLATYSSPGEALASKFDTLTFVPNFHFEPESLELTVEVGRSVKACLFKQKLAAHILGKCSLVSPVRCDCMCPCVRPAKLCSMFLDRYHGLRNVTSNSLGRDRAKDQKRCEGHCTNQEPWSTPSLAEHKDTCTRSKNHSVLH